MSESVVVSLEAVQVQYGQGETTSGTPRAVGLVVEGVVEMAAIVEAGQLAALDALTDANNGPIFNFVNVTVRARSIVDLCSSSMHRPIHTYIF